MKLELKDMNNKIKKKKKNNKINHLLFRSKWLIFSKIFLQNIEKAFLIC